MTNDSRPSSGKDPISRLLGDRDPLEVARELFVYAPIGVASRFSKDLPGLIEEGRNKYGVAKVVGTFAAQQSRRQFEERLRTAAHGFWSPPSTPAAGDPPNSPDSPQAADEPAGMTEPDVEAPAPAAVANLPIPRYDTLSASQVLTHLAGLTAEQRSVVAEYERNSRNRRTILNRIAQLDSAQS
jgi:hypothetical protein